MDIRCPWIILFSALEGSTFAWLITSFSSSRVLSEYRYHASWQDPEFLTSALTCLYPANQLANFLPSTCSCPGSEAILHELKSQSATNWLPRLSCFLLCGCEEILRQKWRQGRGVSVGCGSRLQSAMGKKPQHQIWSSGCVVSVARIQR